MTTWPHAYEEYQRGDCDRRSIHFDRTICVAGGFDRSHLFGTIKDLRSGVRRFASDFSIVSALQGLKPLVQMTRSSNPRDALAVQQILKTAAVVAQMNGAQEAYRQMTVSSR